MRVKMIQSEFQKQVIQNCFELIRLHVLLT